MACSGARNQFKNRRPPKRGLRYTGSLQTRETSLPKCSSTELLRKAADLWTARSAPFRAGWRRHRFVMSAILVGGPLDTDSDSRPWSRYETNMKNRRRGQDAHATAGETPALRQ
jgi:hypothetical protein